MKKKILFYSGLIMATIVIIVAIVVATYNIVNDMSVKNSVSNTISSEVSFVTNAVEEFTTTNSMQTEPVEENIGVTDCPSENYEVSDKAPEVETKSNQSEIFESYCCYRIYIVKDGDNLTYVSTLAGCSVEEIIRLNNIENPDIIYPGLKLLLPAGK